MPCGNTVVIGRPTKSGFNSAQCTSNTCGNLSAADPLNKNQLSPRKNRSKIKSQLREYILQMLGAPRIKLELDEQNIDFAVDQALMIFESYAPREYFSYHTFRTIPGKSVYEMPPDIGFIRSVNYKEQGTFAFQASDLDGAIPIEYFYPGGSYSSIQGGLIDPTQPIWGRMGEWVLYKQYEQMFSRVSSNIGGWEWIGGFNHIKLYPIPRGGYTVIVHYLQKQKDWAEVNQSMQEGALIFAKEILGRIRSKFSNPIGPGGGVQLDGQTLIAEAREDKQKWFDDLIYKYGDILPITMG